MQKTPPSPRRLPRSGSPSEQRAVPISHAKLDQEWAVEEVHIADPIRCSRWDLSTVERARHAHRALAIGIPEELSDGAMTLQGYVIIRRDWAEARKGDVKTVDHERDAA